MTDPTGQPDDPSREQLERLVRRIEALSERVERLERASRGIGPQPEDRPEADDAPPATSPPVAEQETLPDARETADPRRAALRRLTSPREQSQADSPPALPPDPASPGPSPPAPPRSPKPKREPLNLEWLLGARGLALGGVVIVVVGFGMFLKYAYDEGWIGAIRPAWRCAGTAAFGALLVGAGEVLRRRVNPLASSGVTAAGIAIVYGAVLAADKLYGLLPPAGAFALLAGVTVGGVLLGSVSNRVMLSLLSLVGAFLAPPLLATGEPSYVAMPVYLLCLLALGLALSAWRGGAYAHVRRLAWWGTGVLGTLWIASVYDDAPISPIAFVASAWGMTIAELILSARFFGAVGGRPGWPESSRAGFRVGEGGEIRFDPRSLLAPEARWLNAAFGATVWAVVAGAITIRAHRPELDFLAPLGVGLASLAAALLAAGAGRRGWLPEPPSPRSALGAALALNALLLMVATIATALGGWVQVAAWSAVGVAAVESARRLRFRALGVFGCALVAVALARLLTLDLLEHAMTDPALTAAGLALTPWSAQLVLVALAWAVIARRARHATERTASACLVAWCPALALVHPESEAYAIGGAWAVLGALAGWATLRLRARASRINAHALAAIGLLIAWAGQVSLDATAGPGLVIEPVSMVVTGLAWAALAALPRSVFALRTLGASLAIACGAVAIGRVEASHGPDRMLLAQTAYAGLALLAGARLVRWSLSEIATVLLLALGVGWGAVRVAHAGDALAGPPLAHPGFGPAGLGVIGLIVAGVLLRRIGPAPDAPAHARDTRRLLALGAHAGAWALLLASTSIEAARLARTLFEDPTARGAAVSIWWSLFGVASVVLGFRVGAALRWAGLVLLGVVAGKVLLLDTMTLNPPARVVAAITVGLVSIGASVLYARLVGGRPLEVEPEATDGPA
ncbi:MAG: DUF2339 domain-containing protein [Phycisphaerales bacterium JB040]